MLVPTHAMDFRDLPLIWGRSLGNWDTHARMSRTGWQLWHGLGSNLGRVPLPISLQPLTFSVGPSVAPFCQWRMNSSAKCSRRSQRCCVVASSFLKLGGWLSGRGLRALMDMGVRCWLRASGAEERRSMVRWHLLSCKLATACNHAPWSKNVAVLPSVCATALMWRQASS